MGHSVGAVVKRPYITAHRLEEIRERLAQRQLDVVEDVGRLRIVSGDQLARLHYHTTEAGRRLARRELTHLVAERVLLRDDRRVGGVRAGSAGFIYGLDVAGQRLITPDRRRWWPRPSTGDLFTRHTLAVSEIYVRLQEATRAGDFEMVDFQAEPACWRSSGAAGGGRVILKPDAYAVTAAGGYEDHVFVEVDLGSETRPRLMDKGRRYVDYFQSGVEQARSGVFPQAVWLAPDPHRAELIVSALARLDAEFWQLFTVTTIDQAVGAITGAATPEVGP